MSYVSCTNLTRATFDNVLDRQDFATEFYGKEPLNQSQSRPRRERAQIAASLPALQRLASILAEPE